MLLVRLAGDVTRVEKTFELIEAPATAEDEGVRKLLGGRGEQIPWNLNLTQIIQVEPRTAAQNLHRDGGYLQFNFDGKLEHQISTIWALHDFTSEIGAT